MRQLQTIDHGVPHFPDSHILEKHQEKGGDPENMSEIEFLITLEWGLKTDFVCFRSKKKKKMTFISLIFKNKFHPTIFIRTHFLSSSVRWETPCVNRKGRQAVKTAHACMPWQPGKKRKELMLGS